MFACVVEESSEGAQGVGEAASAREGAPCEEADRVRYAPAAGARPSTSEGSGRAGADVGFPSFDHEILQLSGEKAVP